MTVGDLLNAQEAIAALYQAKVDGTTALRIRRAVRKMQEPLTDYNEALREWATDEGIDGRPIADLTAAQRQYWQELTGADVEQTWETPLSVDDLADVEVSAAQLDHLINAGLVRDEAPVEDGPPESAEAVPA